MQILTEHRWWKLKQTLTPQEVAYWLRMVHLRSKVALSKGQVEVMQILTVNISKTVADMKTITMVIT